ncbi:MAG: DUF3795 domain-containing protein [Thermoplasmatota archaeon]
MHSCRNSLIHSKTITIVDPSLIAPFGLNCGTCRFHLKERKPCPGCRTEDFDKPKTLFNCAIRNCDIPRSNDSDFCYDCGEFPCRDLDRLAKRYKTKYYADVLENLMSIKEIGLRRFMEEERRKWTCSRCQGIISVHTGACSICNEPLDAI